MQPTYETTEGGCVKSTYTVLFFALTVNVFPVRSECWESDFSRWPWRSGTWRYSLQHVCVMCNTPILKDRGGQECVEHKLVCLNLLIFKQNNFEDIFRHVMLHRIHFHPRSGSKRHVSFTFFVSMCDGLVANQLKHPILNLCRSTEKHTIFECSNKLHPLFFCRSWLLRSLEQKLDQFQKSDFMIPRVSCFTLRNFAVAHSSHNFP